MSHLFIYNSRHSESTLVVEESPPQKSRVILRFTQNDRSLYVFFLRRLLPLAILFILAITACTDAQVFTDKDVEICKSTFQLSEKKNLSSKPINEVIVEIGKSFIGTDYVSHTLEVDGEEQLVINLTGFDCNTFLENVLVFSRGIKKGQTTFEDYQNELNFIRYRDGEIDQYPSRLHYFTDWIHDNENKGIVKDITKEKGGDILELDMSFMTTHPQYYKHLRGNPDFIPLIKKQEEEINKRDYYFIPQ